MNIHCLANPFDIGLPVRIHRQGKINNPNVIEWPANFSEKLRGQLAQLGTIKVIRKGQQVQDSSSDPGAFCIVISGALKSQLCDAEGSNVILDFYLTGDILSLTPTPQAQLLYETVALTTSQLYILPLSAFQLLTRTFPEFLHFHSRIAHLALLDAHKRIIMIGHLDADQKIAYFLVNLSARMKHQHCASTRFLLPMSRVELSQHLFLSPETVSRSFSKFQMKGYLEAHRSDICIQDFSGLLEVLCREPACTAQIAKPA